MYMKWTIKYMVYRMYMHMLVQQHILSHASIKGHGEGESGRGGKVHIRSQNDFQGLVLNFKCVLILRLIQVHNSTCIFTCTYIHTTSTDINDKPATKQRKMGE